MRWRFLLFPARVEPVNAAAASATSALSALPLLVQASRPILDVGPGAMCGREGGQLSDWAYLSRRNNLFGWSLSKGVVEGVRGQPSAVFIQQKGKNSRKKASMPPSIAMGSNAD